MVKVTPHLGPDVIAPIRDVPRIERKSTAERGERVRPLTASATPSLEKFKWTVVSRKSSVAKTTARVAARVHFHTIRAPATLLRGRSETKLTAVYCVAPTRTAALAGW